MKQALYSSLQFGTGHAVSAAEKAKIFHDGKVAVKTEALRNVAELRAYPLPVFPRVCAFDGRMATGRMGQAAQHSHRGCLASAVWAEKTEDRPSLDLKGKILHCMNVHVTLAQVVEHYDRFVHCETLLR